MHFGVVRSMFNVKKKAASPLYEQIKDGLRSQVDAGVFKPGDCIPDENVLAAQLKVSHMTVRRAVVELSREGLFKRIVGKGTFVRDGKSVQPRTRKGSVAIVSTADPREVTSQIYYRLVQYVLADLEETGMPIVFRTLKEPYAQSIDALKTDPSLRGIIAIWIGEPDVSKLLAELSVPIVLLDCVQPEPAMFDEVAQNGEIGVFNAVNWLIKMGHTDIALMQASTLNSIGLRRQNGYLRALTSNGLTARNERIYPIVYWGEAAYATTRRLLNEPKPPTAIVCTGDVLAIGAIAAVNEHGWRVPKDMSIVGFGDDGYFTVPQLSTVHVPIAEMGAAAARLLSERMKRPAAPPQRVEFATSWLSRGSCDCPRHH